MEVNVLINSRTRHASKICTEIEAIRLHDILENFHHLSGNAKNFRTELKHVVTQYFVRHTIILGVEDANDVSILTKVGSKVAQSKVPIAISMSLKMAFGCGVQ